MCPNTGEPIAQDPALRVGDMIGDSFRIGALIGVGATSEVFEAEDLRAKRTVAIKIGKNGSRRFEQEAQVASEIHHRNVCPVFAFGRLPSGRPYLVMEAPSGRTLARELRLWDSPMDPALAVSITWQLLSGLRAAHKRGVVHRDVKPSNVFLLGRGADPVVRLIDFGFAKPPPERALVVTRPGFTFGTPGYMAPELLRGETPHARHDLWGVAVTLFEMLAGVNPFAKSAHASVRAPPLAELAPHVAPELVKVIDVALRKEPLRRFQTAGQFRRALLPLRSALGAPRAARLHASAPPLPVLYDPAESTTSSSTLPIE